MAAVSRFDTLDQAAEAAAAALAGALEAGLAARGRASLVATGGQTPGPVFDRLARRPLDWSRVEVTLSDERWVEPDQPASNERQVRARLLTGPAAAAKFVPLKTDDATPQIAQPEVERRLAAMSPPFDAVMLGMGDDGHIASLFPGMAGLAEGLDSSGTRLSMAVEPGRNALPNEPRLGLTLAALASARTVVVFIAGEAKWSVWEKALAGDDALEMPVRALIRAAPVQVIWGP